MSDLIKALGFNGRYASETTDEAASRRIIERKEAAATITQLQAELAEAREQLARIQKPGNQLMDWIRINDPEYATAIEARDWSKP